MSTPVPKLHYYNMGGRAAPARLAFLVGGVEFEDIRYADGDAIDAAMKENPALFPCETVPVLQVGDVVVSQSRDIAYYAARVAKILPEDPIKMLDVDEAFTTVDELTNTIVATMGGDEDKLEAVRAEWMEKKGKPILARLTAIFERGSKEGPFLHGAAPSIADFVLTATVGFFASGMISHVPQDFITTTSPRLGAVAAAVMAHPPIAAYMQKYPTL